MCYCTGALVKSAFLFLLLSDQARHVRPGPPDLNCCRGFQHNHHLGSPRFFVMSKVLQAVQDIRCNTSFNKLISGGLRFQTHSPTFKRCYKFNG